MSRSALQFKKLVQEAKRTPPTPSQEIPQIEEKIPKDQPKIFTDSSLLFPPQPLTLCPLLESKLSGAESLFYVQNFITPEEEKWLTTEIYQSGGTWREVNGRRLQNWGGTPTLEGLTSPQKLPNFLDAVAKRIQNYGIFEATPNHVLINEYDGNQGIYHHKDGPAYFPRVAILTLNGSSCLSFKKEVNQPPFVELFTEPRSLLVFQDDLYENAVHGIERLWTDEISPVTLNAEIVKLPIGSKVERSLRVSLTIRIVPSLKTETYFPLVK